MSQIINPISRKLTNHLSHKRQGLYFILLFAFIGFLLSVTQIFGESPDYSQYDDFFDLVRSEGLNILVASRFESGFSIYSVFLTTLFTTNVIVYGWIVIAAMLLKGWAISSYSTSQKIFFVVAVFYFARFYPFHELTQLRAACAIGFLMVAATFLWNGNRLYGLLACAAAFLFHMSAAVMFPVLFIQLARRWQVILIGLSVFVLVFAGAGFVSDYLGNYISVFAGYQAAGFGDNAPNPFSVALLLDWAMIAVSIIMWNRLSLLMKRIVLLEIIGMAIFYGLLDYPVIAHRLRELYTVFWVFFVADGLRLKSMIIPTAGFTMASIGLYSYFFIFSGTFFQ